LSSRTAYNSRFEKQKGIKPSTHPATNNLFDGKQNAGTSNKFASHCLRILVPSPSGIPMDESF
jgi:hypothetical protein